MASNDLSPAGTGTYSSNTLHVGDGTWDSGRDTFLLPNLVGLNFDTMRYNGMGNRFRGLPEYHRLILGHGVLAAITFLGIFPLAIFFAKFGLVNRRQSLRFHVYCQILVLFLSTVILILGWFAVGPRRSLTNPHHGIGIAIYVLIWVQFLYGWLMSQLERRRKNPLTRIPLKVWLHKLLGRTIALLGIIQIPLGLTLYGSPKVLFILYALAAAFLLFSYLTLDRLRYEKQPIEAHEDYYSEYGSYLSGSRTQFTGDSRRRPPVQEKKSHWARNFLAAGGALGAYEAFKHRRMRKREEREQMEVDAERQHRRRPDTSYGPSTVDSEGRPMSRPTSAGGTMYNSRHRSDSHQQSDYSRPPRHDRLSTETWEDDEKVQRPHTWRDRLLGAAGGIAAIEGVRRILGRKQKDNPPVNRYRPTLGGNSSFVTQTDVSRIRNGHAPFSPGTPGGRVHQDASTMTPSRPSRRTRTRTDGDSELYDEDDSFVSPPRKQNEETHTLRNSIATLGAIAGFREWNNRRRDRREQERADRIRREELQNEENYNRRTSNNYPRPQDSHGARRASYSETLMTGGTGPAEGEHSSVEHHRPNTRPSAPDTLQPPLPAAAGGMPSGYSEYANTAHQEVPPNVPAHATVGQDFPQGYQLPPPPPGPPPGMGRPTDYQPPIPGSAQMPMGAVNPDPSRLLSHDNIVGESAAVGGVTGLAAGALGGGQRQSPSPSPYRARPGRRGSGTTATSANYPPPSAAGRAQSASSPPISLKMKVHDDGRHVTIRRLSEEQAAAERAARRPDRNQRQRRTSSLSSAVGDEFAGRSSAANRRTGPIRRSSDQPITNIPPPPAMSSSLGRPSELNLPGRPEATASPSSQRLSPYPPSAATNIAAGIGSGLSGGFGSPGDAGTGTDVSAFADNRRRRRAERARRLEAARGTGNTNRVEFE